MKTKDKYVEKAKKIKNILNDLNIKIKHAQSLELIARYEENQTWNSLSSKIERNDQDFKNQMEYYQDSIKKSLFKDHINLGILKEKGYWLKKNFGVEPNALFVGHLGSGKSYAMKISIHFFLLNNPNSKVLLFDNHHRLNDFKIFKNCKNVNFLRDPNSLSMILNQLNKELKLRSQSDLQKNGVLNKIILVIENFDKLLADPRFSETDSSNLVKIIRVGRAMGIWVIASSSKASKTELPSKLCNGLTNKIIFKTDIVTSTYLTGNDNASKIKNTGEAWSDYGFVQFPLFEDSFLENLLKKLKNNYNKKGYLVENMEEIFDLMEKIN